MSNGIFREVKEIIDTGNLPQKVSNRLLGALIMESLNTGKENSEDIDDLQMDVVVLKASDRKWGGLAAVISTIGALFNVSR